MPSEPAPEELSHFIWRTRYRDPQAHPPEQSIADTWDRVARSVAAVERDPPLWQARFRRILDGCNFLPILSLRGSRRVLDADGTAHSFPVVDRAYALWRALAPHGRRIPGVFPDGTAIAPGEQLLMQGALQEFVDGSISKTVALGSGATPDEVREVLERAHRLGLKGCTVFRQGVRPGIMTTRPPEYILRGQDPHCCDMQREPV